MALLKNKVRKKKKGRQEDKQHQAQEKNNHHQSGSVNAQAFTALPCGKVATTTSLSLPAHL